MHQKAVRSDIQGLRAVAVVLVLLFHVWPNSVTGGFVGVDVFFVVSGYLISKQLLRSISEIGTIKLFYFWGARLRRLMPAALLVLLVCLLWVTSFFPKHSQYQAYLEITASALYLQNWLLAYNSVDYLSAENQATLVQHYWSLSLEEQFYLLWPIIILLVVKITNTNDQSEDRRLTLISTCKWSFLFLLFTSLSYSIYLTSKRPELAYMSTLVRVWEFAVGAVLCVSFTNKVFKRQWIDAVSSWFGIALIVLAAFVFTKNTSFPSGNALLPVMGAALVIAGNTDHSKYSFGWFSRISRVKYIGDISYSIYLWHWPIIVAIPLTGWPIANTWLSGTLVILSTFILASITKTYIEDPFRKDTYSSNQKNVTFVILASAISLITLSWILIIKNDAFIDHKNLPKTVQIDSINSLKAQLAETLKTKEWRKADQLPGKSAQAPEWVIDKCNNIDVYNRESLDKCVYGNRESETVLAVIGDSWATHLLPALRHGFASDWRIQVLTLSQCPVSNVAVHEWGKTEEFDDCNLHRIGVLEWLKANKPNLIIISDSPISTFDRMTLKKEARRAALREAMPKAYKEIGQLALPTIHIESPPRMNCSSKSVNSPLDCVASKSTHFERKLSEDRLAQTKLLGIQSIDMTYWVCTRNLICPNQIGEKLIKADTGHFSGRFSRSLGDILKSEITGSMVLSD